VNATIRIASVSTGNEKRDAHLRTADWFDVEKYPEMRFRSERVEVVSPDEFRVHGVLTIRDVSRRVVLPVRRTGAQNVPAPMQAMMGGAQQIAGFETSLSIDRTDFGVGSGNWPMTTVVGAPIEIHIAMEAHMDLYMAIMFGRAGLGREEREMIAVVVSAANQCEYCVQHHAAALNAYWRDEARLERFVAGERSAELPARTRAVLEYAEALTRDPGSMMGAHVRALREQGLEDEEILAVNLVVAYFNFVNRIAQGLGVEVTAEEVQGYRY
jgi:uncharacterized peroxidase-related enzyme